MGYIKSTFLILLSLCLSASLLLSPLVTVAATAPTTRSENPDFLIKMEKNVLTILVNNTVVYSSTTKDQALKLMTHKDGDIIMSYTDNDGKKRKVSLGQSLILEFSGEIDLLIFDVTFSKDTVVRIGKGTIIKNLQAYAGKQLNIGGTVDRLLLNGPLTAIAENGSKLGIVDIPESKGLLELLAGSRVTGVIYAAASSIKGSYNPSKLHPPRNSAAVTGGGGGSYESSDNGDGSDPSYVDPSGPNYPGDGGDDYQPYEPEGVFLSFNASITDLLVGESELVYFSAEITDGYEPADGEMTLYDEGGALICYLYDDAGASGVSTSDAIAGDNVYSGQALLSSSVGKVEKYYAVSGGEQSAPLSINYYSPLNVASKEYLAMTAIEDQLSKITVSPPANNSATGRGSIAYSYQEEVEQVIEILTAGLDSGMVLSVERAEGSDVVCAEFATGVLYLWIPEVEGTNGAAAIERVPVEYINYTALNDDTEDSTDPETETQTEEDSEVDTDPGTQTEGGSEAGTDSETQTGEESEADTDSDSSEVLTEAERANPITLHDADEAYPMISYAAAATPGRVVLSVVTDDASYFTTDIDGFTDVVKEVHPGGVPPLLKAGLDFTHERITPAMATVEKIKTALKGKDVIIWNGHGSYSATYGGVLVLGEFYTAASDAKYAADITAKRICHTSSGKFAITSLFFDTYYSEGDLKDTIVYSGACLAGKDNKLPNALIKKGASTVMMYNETVFAFYSRDMMTVIMQQLATKTSSGDRTKTVAEAVASAKSKWGTDDLQNPERFYTVPQKTVSAKLVVFGDAEATIYKKPVLLNIDNPSFEQKFTGWNTSGDTRILQKMGAVSPTDGKFMAMAGTGMGYQYPFDTNVESVMTRDFLVSPGQKLLLDYNMVSEELPVDPAWEGTYDDTLRFSLIVSGKEYLVKEIKTSDKNAGWSSLGGDYFYGGDDSTWHTGWHTLEIDFGKISGVTITDNTQVQLKVRIWDVLDSYWDSVVVLDNLRPA